MCRSIKQLRQTDTEPSDLEIQEAALQYVRKVSGYRKPASRNEEAFNAAVEQIARASKQMLDSLA